MAKRSQPKSNQEKRPTRRRTTSENLPTWWRPYFAAIGENRGFKGAAADACGIDRSTPAQYILDHPELKERFDADMATAMDYGSEMLMKEAVRRGEEGVEEPVFQGGKQVGTVRKFSDTLLMFTLNARGKGTRNTQFTLDLSKLTDEQLRRLADGEDPVAVVASGGGGKG